MSNYIITNILDRDDITNSAIDAMKNCFDKQDDSYIGPFWYDPNKQECYGYVLTLCSDVPYYKSSVWNKEIKTSNALHQSIWKKEAARGKDKRFTGDYTLKPRGRVFYFKDEGYIVFTGNWITNNNAAKSEIINVFQLPNDTKFIIDSHWDIGHGWSQEF